MIEPTSSLFYNIVREIFGEQAALASRLVSKVVAVDKDHPYCKTLCVDKDGVIMVNRAFWARFIRDEVDAKIVLAHELFHCVLGDHAKLVEHKEDENEIDIMGLSMDMRINAAICTTFVPEAMDATRKNVLKSMYSQTGATGLLRPGSNYGTRNKYRLMYNVLYGGHKHQRYYGEQELENMKQMFASEDDLRRALKMLLPKKPKKEILLIGYHGGDDEGDDGEGRDEAGVKIISGETGEEKDFEGLPEDLKEQIRSGILDKLGETAMGAGMSEVLFKNVVQVVRSSRQMKLQALDRFACNKRVNEIKNMWPDEKRRPSPIPTRPTHREMSLLAAGTPPLFYKNLERHERHKKSNIAIYLDVSGSVHSHLPKILGVIATLKQQIRTVYCFSNMVSTHSMVELQRGEFETTGGTDFDCVAQHAIDENVDKAVIFTDGYADIYHVRGADIQKQLKDVAMVYFGHRPNRDNWFDNTYGKSFELEELV